MHNMNVEFLISNSQYERLQRITNSFRENGMKCKEETIFSAMMQQGMEELINKKLDFQEKQIKNI